MKNNQIGTYRLMQVGEEDVVFELVLQGFHQYIAPTYSRNGIETFLSLLSVDFLKENGPNRFTLVAEHQAHLVGMLTNISTGHIALLFVDSAFQGYGIGKNLLHYYMKYCLEKYPRLTSITVSASLNSQSFYEHTGFVKMDVEQEENGMWFIPMQRSINVVI
ncbi:MAG: GNAT family N-acetyltransferase [Desulfobacteraceae bacterium]